MTKGKKSAKNNLSPIDVIKDNICKLKTKIKKSKGNTLNKLNGELYDLMNKKAELTK